MENVTGNLAGLPAGYFQEAKGDEAYIDAVWEAATCHQCTATPTMFPTNIKH